MSDEQNVDIMATELAGNIMRVCEGEPVYGSDLVSLVRAVVRDELDRAQQQAEAAHKLSVQDHWDSDEFKAQVDALREGRPVVAEDPILVRFEPWFTATGKPCVCVPVPLYDTTGRPTGWDEHPGGCQPKPRGAEPDRECCGGPGLKAGHICWLHTGRCCYPNSEICPKHH